MQRCLTLAGKGFGSVSPNPMVGCVIVRDGVVIGEGYHEQYGGPHAEVNAVRSVQNTELLRGSTVYVSLEPCSHFGKTPPCADLLISNHVAEVIIGMKDPNPLVCGNGIEKLQAAGIRVRTGILEPECRDLNKRFIVYQIAERPYVILKWAESADGYMGNASHRKISSDESQVLLHRWRSEEDAFLIGTNTLCSDNPQLSNRLYTGKNPVRVAVDMELRSFGKPLHFYDGTQKTIILNGVRDESHDQTTLRKVKNNEPASLLEALYNEGIQSVVVEGGAKLLNSFIKSGLYDELRILRSDTLVLGHGLQAPEVTFTNCKVGHSGTDTIFTGK